MKAGIIKDKIRFFTMEFKDKRLVFTGGKTGFGGATAIFNKFKIVDPLDPFSQLIGRRTKNVN